MEAMGCMGAHGRVGVPLAIVLHEFVRYLVGWAFGFPDLVLHYGHASDSAAKTGFPLWQQGVEAIGGPLATLLIVVGCRVAVLRVGLVARQAMAARHVDNWETCDQISVEVLFVSSSAETRHCCLT